MKKIVIIIICIFILGGCASIKKDTSNECCTCEDCPSCDMCCPCK